LFRYDKLHCICFFHAHDNNPKINFLDHGKLVLASDGEVLYIDENRDVKLLNLTALEASKALVIAGKYEDAEIVRRIR